MSYRTFIPRGYIHPDKVRPDIKTVAQFHEAFRYLDQRYVSGAVADGLAAIWARVNKAPWYAQVN